MSQNLEAVLTIDPEPLTAKRTHARLAQMTDQQRFKAQQALANPTPFATLLAQARRNAHTSSFLQLAIGTLSSQQNVLATIALDSLLEPHSLYGDLNATVIRSFG